MPLIAGLPGALTSRFHRVQGNSIMPLPQTPKKPENTRIKFQFPPDFSSSPSRRPKTIKNPQGKCHAGFRYYRERPGTARGRLRAKAIRYEKSGRRASHRGTSPRSRRTTPARFASRGAEQERPYHRQQDHLPRADLERERADELGDQKDDRCIQEQLGASHAANRMAAAVQHVATVHAQCSNVPNGLGFTCLVQVSAHYSRATRDASARCSAPGRRLAEAGAAAAGGASYSGASGARG